MHDFECLKRVAGRLLVLAVLLMGPGDAMAQTHRVASPDEAVVAQAGVTEDGQPFYHVRYHDHTVVDTSLLGYVFDEMPPLRAGLAVVGTERRTVDETWEPVWGTDSEVRNHFNELTLTLREQDAPHRQLHLVFRIYDDGVGFRYEIPRQPGIASFTIMDELTQVRLTGDHTTWWIPADYDSYEYLYTTSPISEIRVDSALFTLERPDREIRHQRAVNTPVTFKTADGLYLSLHEANLTDYAGMTLVLMEDYTFTADLVPWASGEKVKASAPMVSPWRTIQIAETPGALVASHLIENLNEPNRLGRPAWIEPMKYTGIWWSMHVGETSWAMNPVEGTWSDKGEDVHGATTERAKDYIDFTADAGIKGFLVEGWNTGWEYWGSDSLGFFDFTTPYPDFDLEAVVTYARERGVGLVGHHETGGDVPTYEERLEAAMQLYHRLGVHAVKTGYAGPIRPTGEYHHGQYLVRHYRRVIETAARYEIMVDAHEPIKDTGLRRTYPNMMTREGVRGMEYNAWSEGNPPEHTTILPFTRMLAGPIDYTPGIFDLTFDAYRATERVYATLANQLALYVVIYSPLQMVADLPVNYQEQPAFQFIKDVGVDWQESRVLAAEIGDYVTIARKEKGSNRWFLGSITDEESRRMDVPLSFLEAGVTYVATIYADAPDADWETNPTAITIDTYLVDTDTVLDVRLAPGGGQAISLLPATDADLDAERRYER